MNSRPPPNPLVTGSLGVLIATSGGWLGLRVAHEAHEESLTHAPPDATPVTGERPTERARPNQPTVLLVVFDTTRADRLSACGYGRPTTPTLERLVREGASLSCEARTPGSWTVPSHASYFTGLSVPEHGADNARVPVDRAAALGALQVARPVKVEDGHERWLTVPLQASHTTIAERFRAGGYQTALVTANRNLSPALGLTQGFEHVAWAVGPGVLHGLRLVYGPGHPNTLLPQTLAALDPERPLFLVTNFMYAHDPWDAVPPSQGWVPERPAIAYLGGDPGDPWTRFENGDMSPHEAADFLVHLDDVYDWGIRRNDDALAALLRELEDTGWTSAGLRLVLVGDHGELLGEHGLLEHGRTLHEPNTRVPLLVHDTNRPITLPGGPISATAVHDLLLHGALPPSPPPVMSHGFPMWHGAMFHDERARQREAAIWEGTRKLVWREGSFVAFDLRDDPGETAPLPVTPAERARLEVEAARMEAISGRSEAPTVEVVEALRAAGYVE